LLSCRGVTKSFGDHRVLEGIDVEVDRHQVVTLIGSSVSG